MFLRQNVVMNCRGETVAGASIRVYDDSGAALVPIYYDEAGTLPVPASTVTSDSQGRYSYWAPAGSYEERIVREGYKTQSVYVQIYDNGGASGSCCFIINVKSFGATGDGVVDDSPAVQSAFDYAAGLDPSFAPRIYFPAGRYLLGSQIVFTAQNGSNENGLVILGDGTGSTKLIAAPSNDDGCIKLIGISNEQTWTVRDLSFVSLRSLVTEATQNNGTALWITSTVAPGVPGYGTKEDYGIVIENVEVVGDSNNPGDTARAGVWQHGIRIDYAWFPVIRNCWVKGAPHSTYPGVAQPGNLQNAIYFKHCYDPRVLSSYVLGYWEVGIRLEGVTTSGDSFEGGVIDKTNIVGPLTGIYLSHATSPKSGFIYEPGFHVMGSHMNCPKYAIHLDTYRQINISDNYFYSTYGSTQTKFAAVIGDLPAAIFLQNIGDTVVSNNMFLEPGFYDDDDHAWVGVKIEGALCRGILLTGNLFNHGGVSVRVDTNDSQKSIVAHGNHWGGQSFGAWDTNVKYVDKTNALTIFDFDVNAGANKDTINLTSSKTGGGASPVLSLKRHRNDYGAIVDAPLAAIEYEGLNSAGNENHAATIRADWIDNSAGAETSKLTFFVENNGSPKTFVELVPNVNVDRVRVSSQSAASAGSPALVLARLDPRYASVHNGQLGQYEWIGLDSAGAEKTAAAIRADWADNTAGTEDAVLTVFVRKDGALVIPMNIYPNGAFFNLPVTGNAFTMDALTVNGMVINPLPKFVGGAAYTLLLEDWSRLIDHAHGSAITVQLPKSLPAGWECFYQPAGTGIPTFVPELGAFLNNADGHNKARTRWSCVHLRVRANTDGNSADWVLTGDTA